MQGHRLGRARAHAQVPGPMDRQAGQGHRRQVLQHHQPRETGRVPEVPERPRRLQRASPEARQEGRRKRPPALEVRQGRRRDPVALSASTPGEHVRIYRSRKLRWRERNPCSTCARCCRTGGTMCWRGRCATKPCQAACARRHRACATALASSHAKTYLLGLWRRSTQSTRSALAAPAWSWNSTMASAASDWRARRTGWRFGTSRSRTGAPSKCGSTPTRRVASTAGSAILPTTPPPPRRRWVPAPRRRSSRGTMKKPRPPATW